MENDEVTLVVETTIVLSKKKLSEMSDYFNAMFNSDFVEKDKSIIKLKGVSARSLEHIGHFVKYGKIEEVPENSLAEEMIALLEAANMLQLTKVKERCSKILLDILDVDNAIPILDIASSLDLKDLIRKARAVALGNFDDVSKLDAFCKLSASQVEGLVNDRALHIPTGEWGVWEAIERWVNYSEGVFKERVVDLPKLVQCLHLESLTTSDLRRMAESKSLRASPMISKAVRRVIDEREYFWEESEERSEESEQAEKFLEKWRTTERRKLPYVPALLGSVHPDPEIFSPWILRFIETERKFVPVVRLSHEIYSLGSMRKCKMISSGSKLYLLGAKVKSREGIWTYDVLMKKWTFLSEFSTPITHAFCMGNYLYVINKDQRILMKLNLDDRKWTACAKVPESISVKYIPSRDVWITLETAYYSQHFNFAMANEDFIFLFDNNKNVYKFDPTYPSTTPKFLGAFNYLPIYDCTCLIEDNIYSFSKDIFKKEFYFEKLNTQTGESTVLCLGTVDSMKFIACNYCCPLLWY